METFHQQSIPTPTPTTAPPSCNNTDWHISALADAKDHDMADLLEEFCKRELLYSPNQKALHRLAWLNGTHFNSDQPPVLLEIGESRENRCDKFC
jgi:hypothetical protein